MRHYRRRRSGAVGDPSLFTTPLYEASTRLFVSTTSGSSLSDVYQGNLFSQQRVISYTKLLIGDTLAQRTIDKLDLNMSAAALRAKREGECARHCADRRHGP